jgi:hypothetical protein
MWPSIIYSWSNLSYVTIYNLLMIKPVLCDHLLEHWVSEWLLFNTNSAIFQLYHGENKLFLDEKMMMTALY